MALGCIGMSRDDFDRCTPSEFYEAWNRWATLHRDGERSSWERARVLAMYIIQPYTKSKLTARDVLPFPWDDEGEKQAVDISPEERKERFEAAKKRYGLT